MPNIQEVFNRIQDLKKQKRDIQRSYTDALKSAPRHQELTDEIKILREDKKQVEMNVKDEFAKELDQLEQLKLDIETDSELLNDLVLNQLVKGESVQIQDQNNQPYEPVFSVKFKKSDG